MSSKEGIYHQEDLHLSPSFFFFSSFLKERHQVLRWTQQVKGLKLHVAEIGTGSTAVVFLNGFPEIWYSWRHQMIAVAQAGYKAIVPDYRGYGLSDPLPEPEKTSSSDLISDLVAILDELAVSKVFFIGKDFGARPAYVFALLYPKRVIGVITVGVPFTPTTPSSYLKGLPEGFFINRWLEPGRAEAEFGRVNAKKVIRNVYIMFSNSELPIAGKKQEIMDLVEPSTPLPNWFTDEDLAVYGAVYEKSGFQTALRVPYRLLLEEFKVANPIVEVPVLLIIGEDDYAMKFPGVEDYIKTGQVKVFVPNLELKYVPEGTHFVQEQFPDQVNQMILSFLQSHS